MIREPKRIKVNYVNPPEGWWVSAEEHDKIVAHFKDELAHLEAIVSQSKILRKHACELTNSAYAIHKRYIPEFTDKMSKLGKAIDRYDSVFNIKAKRLGFIE